MPEAILENDGSDVLDRYNKTVREATGSKKPDVPTSTVEALESDKYGEMLTPPKEITETYTNTDITTNLNDIDKGIKEEKDGDAPISKSDVSGMLSLWTDGGAEVQRNGRVENQAEEPQYTQNNQENKSQKEQPEADMGGLINFGSLFNFNDNKEKEEKERYDKLRQDYENSEEYKKMAQMRRAKKPKVAQPILSMKKPRQKMNRMSIPAPKMPGGNKPKVSRRSRR